MTTRVIETNKEYRDIYNKNLGIIFNGDNNLKPIITENLIDHSATSLLCSHMYFCFVSGGGFEIGSPSLNYKNNTWQDVTLDDLLQDIIKVLSRHKGVFIQIRYNALYEKESFKIIPYSLCRIGKKDSKGYAGKIVVSPNGWGRYLTKKDITVFDVYNPNPNVIQEQVDRDGGWHNYKGQVFFFKLDDTYTYPLNFIETVDLFSDVEYHLGLYYNSTVKRGFENTTIIRHRAFPDVATQQDFDMKIRKVTGLKNSGSIIITEDDWDDESDKSGNFKFDTLKNEVKAEKYKHFEESCSNYIRKAYKVPAQLVDFTQGKLGNTSGEDLRVAQSIYNTLTAPDRKKVSSLFAELFKNYKININPQNNWNIKQFSLLKDGTAN